MKTYLYNNTNYIRIAEFPFDEIQKIDFALCNQPTETLENYYKRQTVKPAAIVNGGFFSMSNGNTCFTFIDEKKKIFERDDLNNGIAIVGDKNLVYGNLNTMANIRDFISAYPPLVINKTKANSNIGNEINYLARRTAIGYNSSKFYIVTVDAPGCRFNTLADIFISLDCTYAIGLDGGGSTRMLYEGNLVTAAAYSRPVDSVVCVYTNPPEEDTVPKVLDRYKVQVGAFNNQGYALSCRDQIRLLSDPLKAGYKNAYIDLVNNIYKVNIGVYSTKTAADKVVKDLKKNHISAFVNRYTIIDK